VAGFFVLKQLQLWDLFERPNWEHGQNLQEREDSVMTSQLQQSLLRDHVDMRLLVTETDEATASRNTIVQLDPDHPGFRDREYRTRRNQIAQIAMSYRPGQPIPEAPYTSAEHQVWHTIWKALRLAHERHACGEYLSCLKRLAFDTERIPQLSDVSESVEAISGFRLEPVAGLVEPRVFLENLANGVFLCTQYIRHHSTPLYTPEPDVAHEIIGHAVTLASERLAELNRLFGEAVKRTVLADRLALLSRLYWFTIEFGVLREEGQVKAYGTGLLSSAGELEEMHKAELRPLDPDAVAEQEYDPTRFQPVLFCADSFQAMYETLRGYLVRWR
jgi:phenylalanine-4-hydroxylase